MIMFNPFDKDIEHIESNDLAKLIENSVREGMYIEYKRTFISSKKISYSVASFANSEGGWFFIGIQDDETNSASDICGFELSDNPQPIEKIRDIIKSNISPIPHFITKLLKISSDKYVLIVKIEKGYQTPYTTKDGRIYRRVAEGSDPIPENDRYSLQKLFERNEEFNQKIELFSANVFTMSKLQEEERQLFVEAYFYVHPFHSFSFEKFYEKDFFYELYEFFNTPLPFIAEPMTANILYNNIQSSKESYILRSFSAEEKIIDITLTVELFENGNCKLLIPINEYFLENLKTLPDRYIGSDALKYVFEKIRHNSIHYIKLIDGHELFTTLSILFNQYFQLLKKHNFVDEIHGRIRLENARRKCVFYNTKEYLEYIQKYNLPISQKSKIEIPEFHGGKTFLFNCEEKIEYLLVQTIIESLGIPQQCQLDHIDELGKYIESIRKK